MTPKNKYVNYFPYVLSLLLLGGLVYSIVHYSNIIDDLEAQIAKFNSNQGKMEGEFAKINDEYNSMMSSLSEKDQLLIESQQQLKELSSQLTALFSKNEITEDDLASAKALIAELKTRLEFENKVGTLEDQIAELEQKNNKSQEEIVQYKELLKKKEQLVTQFETDIKKQKEIIKKGSSLRLVDFDIRGYKIKNNGKEVETDKASKADVMRVSFNINSNSISESGPKDLYISLYNSDGSLAHFPSAKSGSITLQNGDQLEFTDHLSFVYTPGSTEPIKFDWQKDDFESGDYNIKVYENGVLIGSQTTSFR